MDRDPSRRARGKTLGRPRRVFRRDEAVRLRDGGMSWRRIAAKLGVAVTTCFAVTQQRPLSKDEQQPPTQRGTIRLLKASNPDEQTCRDRHPQTYRSDGDTWGLGSTAPDPVRET
jgi:hypothetical protein